MDQALVVRAQRGDQQAFERLAADTYPWLYRLAHAILRDAAMADEATQQALVSVWRNLPRLHDPACYEAWCHRLLVNACHDQVRRRRRWLDARPSGGHEPVAPDELAWVVEHAGLAHALSGLSIDHRTVLALRYLLDLTPDEIADRLAIPRKTVYSRLSRALDEMRSALEAEARPVLPRVASKEAMR
jgi:RNA polymerase sigma-70 factor, ECF subfamily